MSEDIKQEFFCRQKHFVIVILKKMNFPELYSKFCDGFSIQALSCFKKFSKFCHKNHSSKLHSCIIMFLEPVNFCVSFFYCDLRFFCEVFFFFHHVFGSCVFLEILSKKYFFKALFLFHQILGNGDVSRIFIIFCYKMFLQSPCPVSSCSRERS